MRQCYLEKLHEVINEAMKPIMARLIKIEQRLSEKEAKILTNDEILKAMCEFNVLRVMARDQSCESYTQFLDVLGEMCGGSGEDVFNHKHTSIGKFMSDGICTRAHDIDRENFHRPEEKRRGRAQGFG